MDDSFKNLPTSHLLGSVPAVVTEEKEKSTTSYVAPGANMQIFPPNNGGDRGRGGYQTLESPSAEGFEQQPANNWRGVFSISSYTQYFNVDTDIVLDRLLSSLYPIGGDFFTKIREPDLYGLIWISTTLVFVLASLGNCATYLMQKHTDKGTSWSFNVSYMNVAAGVIYGYAAVVPLAFYFLLQYLGSGSNPSLVQFWCMWGYSLFIFVPASFLLLIPVEFVRWVIIIATGAASAGFVASNLSKRGIDLVLLLAAAFVLQFALAVFIKVWFFP